MKKILLHIGLPKTATTTFQLDILMPLHNKKHINFLGRYKTKNNQDYYNPFEPFLDKLYKKVLPDYEIFRLKKDFDLLLKEGTLNVISEEGISITVYDYKTLFKNLSNFLKGYDVLVLISLREPLDFLYSYYVEMYRWVFFKDKSFNSIDKYITKLLTNPELDVFTIHFYGRYLKIIRKSFPNLKVFLYEDLRYDSDNYYNQLSKLLDVDVSFIAQNFSINQRNIKKKSKKGKKSEAINLSDIIYSKVETLKKKKNIEILSNFKILKQIYSIIMNKASLIRLNETSHRFLTEEEKLQLKNLLTSQNELLYKDFNLKKEKLIKYKYL